MRAMMRDEEVQPLASHLSVELQLSSAGSVGVDSEICRFVDDAAQWLQTGTITFHLRRRERSTCHVLE